MTETQRLADIAAELRRRHDGFAHAGLRLEERDIAEETRQMTGLEVEVPSNSVQLWIVEEASDEEVGEVARRIVARAGAPAVAHHQFRIRRESARRRGFATALLAAAEDWYRELGVVSILQEADGDGSLFAACRGFDFDLPAYRRKLGNGDLSEDALRAAAVDDMLARRPGVYETVEGNMASQRRTVQQLLREVAASDAAAAAAVGRFRAAQASFRSPQDIAAFRADERFATLGELSVGRAALQHTTWHAVKRLA